MTLRRISRDLGERVERLSFSAPVACVYNPLWSSTDELVRFQQQFALLLFSYVVLKLLVPKVRPAPWLSYRPPQSMGNPSPA